VSKISRSDPETVVIDEEKMTVVNGSLMFNRGQVKVLSFGASGQSMIRVASSRARITLRIACYGGELDRVEPAANAVLRRVE
jgi:hypothetical protein